ncbi:meckelin [Eurytemora carolleeae]|uniref:meckelin n=1 Tax=Eurytemora carolleeae TaxID=1294199 RepID=UPI000C762825|nr:meckelin [Eurytemora carolleeae]XP_023349287.1 meckelin [Eurytemora carolleeae]|eukprot:XP_023349212.1 meckelin-like [Eurytemora affinis]
MTVSAYMCGRHLNSTSCNLLANLCALTLHDREHPSCSTLKRIADRNNDQTVRRVPSLFLPSGQSSSTAESEAITSSHSLPGRGVEFSNRLNITIARYSIEGHLIAVETAKGNVFHICNISDMIADAAWSFGTRYKKICKVPALALWSMKTEFYDLYYNFPMDQSFPNKDTLYSIFNLVLNSKEQMEEDPKNWVLTTRFFLVDSSASVSGSDKRAKVVRYLEHLEIVITLLDTRKNPLKPGRIHPPITKLRYKEVSLEEAKNNKKVEMTFSVSYRMNMINVEKDVEIAAGVMSALAVLLGAVDAWSWSKRSGKVGIDARTLIKLVVSAAGYLSHIFLAIIFFSSLYWFIFFKQQNFVHTVLPAEDQEAFIKHYLISAFALKLLDIVVLILGQVTVDIFLLDWERPPPRVEKLEKCEELEPPVSVWRTYLVANEWNEIQTTRKSKISLQVLIFLVLMKVVGLENLASADAHNRLWTEEDEYMAEHSYVCRFALGVSIWAGISVFQTLFWVGVYAPIIENKLAQFTDICSLANISVFVMSHSHFGYYIHGKSAHGSADTDMEGLLNQLQREADDLCGHRGLQAGSDQQTFSMILPATLRTYYDKVVTPVFKSEAGRETGRLTSTTLQNSVQAYTTMNRFLTRFLQHALKDLDFEVRERNFIESTLDIEFTNTVTEKAVFYTDKGHSFDCLLLYGHEFTLTIWEILVMSFVDLLAQDFLLAAIITYFVSKFVSVLRYMIGRSNLARKTLIDKRFLI